jgi:hypothetical protein
MSDKPTGQHALSGLVAKRAEIAGQIDAARATLRQLIVDLDHVDAAIRCLIPITMSPRFAPRHTRSHKSRGAAIRSG